MRLDHPAHKLNPPDLIGLFCILNKQPNVQEKCYFNSVSSCSCLNKHHDNQLNRKQVLSSPS